MEHLTGQYFLNCNLRPEEIRTQMRQLCDAGYEVIFLHARSGMKTPYFSQAWFDAVGCAMDELIRNGAKFAIWDEDNYPSGDAGNRICNQYPELAASCLKFHIREAKAGEEIVEFFSENGAFTGCWAIRDDGSLQDLSPFCGTLRKNWSKIRVWTDAYSPAAQLTAPHRRRSMDMTRFALSWTAEYDCRIVYAEWIHWGPGGHCTDLLNPETAKVLLALTHEEYARRFPEQMKKHCAASFMDEPCPAGDFPWTRNFPEEFRQEHGYDLAALLPHLAVNIDSRSARIRSDYRKTLHRLLCNNYLDVIRKWLNERDIDSTGHLSRTEFLSFNGLHWPNELRCLKMLDIPCGDPLGAAIGKPGSAAYHIGLKVVSSAARLFGKKACGADAFAIGGDTISLADLTFMLNYHLVMGLTWFNIHGLYYTMDGERRDEAPPSLFYQHTQWKHMKTFLDLLKKRCEELSGEHICQLEMLYPSTAIQIRLPEETPLDEKLHLAAEKLVSRQRDFELIDEVTLCEQDPAGFAMMRPCFLVAHAAKIERSTAQWLERYAAAGGRVFVTGGTPEILSEPDQDTGTPWLFADSCRDEDFIEKIPAPQVLGEHAENILLRRIRKNGVVRTFLFNRGSKTFRGTLDGAQIVIAPGEGAFADELAPVTESPELPVASWQLTFGPNCMPVYFWESGTVAAIDLIAKQKMGFSDFPEDGSFTAVFTLDDPLENIRFTTEEASLQRGSFALNGTPLTDYRKADFRDCRELECDVSALLKPGRNTLTFQGEMFENAPYLRGKFKVLSPFGNFGYPVLSSAPDVFHLKTPQDYRSLGYGTYSGTAIYESRVRITEANRYTLTLDLVNDSVQISVDGVTQKTLIAPPYQIQLDLSAGEHLIRLEVCNAPGNRDILAGVPAGLQG